MNTAPEMLARRFGRRIVGVVVAIGCLGTFADASRLVRCPPSQSDPDSTTPQVKAASGLLLDDECDGDNNIIQTYEATTFYETITYGMAHNLGYPFSPDGSLLLIASDATGVFNAYAQPVAGGDPVPLTSSTTNAISPVSYFPDDSRLLYAFDEGGNERNHLYVLEEDGITVRDLTPGALTVASFVGWHQDKTAFWVRTNARDEKLFDVVQYNIDNDYNNSTLFVNELGLSVQSISPNGRWIALVKHRTSADSDIYLVDLQDANQTATHITPHEGNVDYSVTEFTKDSTKLIYATNEFGEFYQTWTYDLFTGEKSVLVAADWDVSYVLHSPTGRYRVTAINADGQTEMTITDTQNGDQVLDLTELLPAGDLAQVRFMPDETTLALMVNSDTSPSNIFVISPVGHESQPPQSVQLTSALSPDMDQEDLVDGQVIRYKSFDDLKIPSILYKPHGASAHNKVPALVYVHGGPGGQSRKGWSVTLQHLVNHNFAILAANNRGSSGYGKTFYHMDDRKHGEVDLQDVVYGKYYLESLDWVDGDRIGIIGGSYGGYMTVAALAFEPDVFEAGVDIFGVTNWLRTLTNIPPWWESFRESLYDEMGNPATDEERLRRISPLFHADQITKPLLVVQGANDPRVLQVESDEIVEALRKNNVPVEYLLFDDEGHGFRKKSNRIAASEAYLSFLTTYLKDLNATTTDITTTDTKLSNHDSSAAIPLRDYGIKVFLFGLAFISFWFSSF